MNKKIETIQNKQIIKTLSDAVRTASDNGYSEWAELKKSESILENMRLASDHSPELSNEELKTLHHVVRMAMDDTSPGYGDWEELEPAHQILKQLRTNEQQKVLAAAEREACEKLVRSTLKQAHPAMFDDELEKLIPERVRIRMDAEKRCFAKYKIETKADEHGFTLYQAGKEMSYLLSAEALLTARKDLVFNETVNRMRRSGDEISKNTPQPERGQGKARYMERGINP